MSRNIPFFSTIVFTVAGLLGHVQQGHGQFYFERQFGNISFTLRGGALFENGNVALGGYMNNGNFAAVLLCDSTGHLIEVRSVKDTLKTKSGMIDLKKISTPSGKRLMAAVNSYNLGVPWSNATSVVKVDSQLNIESSINYHDPAFLVSNLWEHADNNSLLLGVLSYDSTSYAATMVQTDLQGTIQWERRIAFAPGVNYTTHKAVSDGHGGYFGGSDYNWQVNYRNVICYRTDSLFNLLWSKRFYFPDTIRNQIFFATRQGELFLITGINDTTYRVGTNNFIYSKGLLVCKLDTASGSILWAKEIGQGTGLIPETIFETSDGNLLIGGQYSHGHEYMINRIDYGGFVLKIDPQGQVLWSDTIWHPDWKHRVDDFDEQNNKLLIVAERFDHLNPFPYIIVTDTSAQIGCTLKRSAFMNLGNISSITDSTFIPFTGQSSALSVTPILAGWWSQIANESAYCATNTGINLIPRIEEPEVFPNPSLDYFNFKFNLASASDGVIELYNLQSARVFFKNISCKAGENILVIPTIEIPRGLYYVRVSTGDKNFCKRIVVE